MEAATQAAIPEQLRAPAEQAVAWLNAARGTGFELTGVVDEGPAGNGGDAAFELGLILCDGDRCTREQVRVTAHSGAYTFAAVDAPPPAIPPLLDPPAGVRADWLDEALSRHDFLLLLFYRGRW